MENRKWELENRKWKLENVNWIASVRDSDFQFLISIFQLLNLSSHRADFLGLDLVRHAHFARLPESEKWISQIFLREFVIVDTPAFFAIFTAHTPNSTLPLSIY